MYLENQILFELSYKYMPVSFSKTQHTQIPKSLQQSHYPWAIVAIIFHKRFIKLIKVTRHWSIFFQKETLEYDVIMQTSFWVVK